MPRPWGAPTIRLRRVSEPRANGCEARWGIVLIGPDSVGLRLPAVDRDHDAVDERCLVGEKEGDEVGDLLRLAEALHRVHAHELLTKLLPAVLARDLDQRALD